MLCLAAWLPGFHLGSLRYSNLRAARPLLWYLDELADVVGLEELSGIRRVPHILERHGGI